MVVAGGFNSDSLHLDSTEIYSPGEDTWRYGGALPRRLRGGHSVQLEETFLAVGGATDDGGFSDAVYAWDNAGEEWGAALGVDRCGTYTYYAHWGTLKITTCRSFFVSQIGTRQGVRSGLPRTGQRAGLFMRVKQITCSAVP